MNALEFFLSPCRCIQCGDRVWATRNWRQFERFYLSLSQLTGSYTQAVQISDPDVIQKLCEIKPDKNEWKSVPPPWWRFNDVMHRLTDIADQLIASRAHGDDVKFYPRPANPAAKARKKFVESLQEDRIEAARRANMERRGLA